MLTPRSTPWNVLHSVEFVYVFGFINGDTLLMEKWLLSCSVLVVLRDVLHLSVPLLGGVRPVHLHQKFFLQQYPSGQLKHPLPSLTTVCPYKGRSTLDPHHFLLPRKLQGRGAGGQALERTCATRLEEQLWNKLVTSFSSVSDCTDEFHSS